MTSQTVDEFSQSLVEKARNLLQVTPINPSRDEFFTSWDAVQKVIKETGLTASELSKMLGLDSENEQMRLISNELHRKLMDQFSDLFLPGKRKILAHGEISYGTC